MTRTSKLSAHSRRKRIGKFWHVDSNRPDKFTDTRGGFTNVEMVFDGKTLTLLGKNTNLYAQIEAPGTIDQLVDVLRDKYHRPVLPQIY